MVIDQGNVIIEKATSQFRIRAFPTNAGEEIIIPAEPITQNEGKKITSTKGNHKKGLTSIWTVLPNSGPVVLDFKMDRHRHKIFHAKLVEIVDLLD